MERKDVWRNEQEEKEHRLSLNTAYVMEFFLQTLVKKKLLAQNNMLVLNQLLMLSSTLPAIQVLFSLLL